MREEKKKEYVCDCGEANTPVTQAAQTDLHGRSLPLTEISTVSHDTEKYLPIEVPIVLTD